MNAFELKLKTKWFYYKRFMWVGRTWPGGGLETVRSKFLNEKHERAVKNPIGRAKPQFFAASNIVDKADVEKQYKKME